MKKDTMYILGGVAVVGLAYYLYKKNQTSTSNNTSGFANISGKTPCPPGYYQSNGRCYKSTSGSTNSSNFANLAGQCGGCGYNQKWTTFLVYNPQYGLQTVNGCLSCIQSGTSK